MRAFKVIALACLLMGGFAYGNSDAIFMKANSDYESGSYTEAANAYKEILKTDGPRVSVLNNLGSSYFKMGENGRAILSFERALVLQPSDPDLLANLKLAQDQVAVYPLKNDSYWDNFLNHRSARSWSVALLATAILLPLATLAWCFWKGKSRIWIVVFAFADLVILGFAIAGLNTKTTESKRGIIVAKSAIVRISPFEKADNRGALAEGREVLLGKENTGYFWVTSEDSSQEGWVANGEVLPVIPNDDKTTNE